MSPNVTINSTPSSSFIAERAALSSYPYIYVTIQPVGDGSATDVSNRLISCSLIDREAIANPFDTAVVRVGDITLRLSNDDGYFSPFVSTSLFYNKNYFNADIKVYAGFYVNDTDVEVTLQSWTLLEKLLLDDSLGVATIYGMGKAKKALEKRIGEPDSDGNSNPLTFYGNWLLKDIVDYLMQEEAGLSSADYSCSDIPVYFTNTVFDDYVLRDALRELAQAASCRVYEDRFGKIVIAEFIPVFGSSVTVLDLSSYIVRTRFKSSFSDLVNKVRVQYADNRYYEEDNTGTLADGQKVVIDNRTLDNDTYAKNLANRISARFGSVDSLPVLEVDAAWLPDKDISDVFLLTSSNLGLSSNYYQAYGVVQNLTSMRTTLRLERADVDGTKWGYLGSSASEGDGLSPQNDTWTGASVTDKLFAYCSETGASSDPRYYMY